jgi:hypothetical protein
MECTLRAVRHQRLTSRRRNCPNGYLPCSQIGLGLVVIDAYSRHSPTGVKVERWPAIPLPGRQGFQPNLEVSIISRGVNTEHVLFGRWARIHAVRSMPEHDPRRSSDDHEHRTVTPAGMYYVVAGGERIVNNATRDYKMNRALTRL